jgi:hypothetical protein
VNGGGDNEAVAASVKNFVWEGMSNYKGQSYEADRAPSEARSDCMDGWTVTTTHLILQEAYKQCIKQTALVH